MKPRHLILIVAIGTSLIALAPTAEKAGQADKVENDDAAQDVKVMPVEDEAPGLQAKIVPANFAGEMEKPTEH